MTPSWNRRVLSRGIAVNLAGAAVPAVLGLVALPAIAAGLGPARLGMLTLAWALLTYLSILHLGVGRALAHVSASGCAGRELAGLAWTGAALTLAAGTLAGVALFLAAPTVTGALHLSSDLATETADALRILAFAIPFTVGAPVFAGLLEARGRFGRINLVATAVSVTSYFGPLVALQVGAGLRGVVAVLAVARAAGWAAHLASTLHAYPEMRRRPAPSMRHAGKLLRFGGWTTVSALASPLMGYMDRFFVAAAVSATAVAYYAAPQEIVVRMGTVSAAVVGVLYPAFAAAGAADPARLRVLLERGAETVFLLVFPLALGMVAFANEGLAAWLGPGFAREGTAVLRWFAVGLLAGALAKPPAALVTAVGRPELAARLHLAELPLYLGCLMAVVSRWGIEGAAGVWAGRAALDAMGMYWLAARVAPGASAALYRTGLLAAGGAAALGTVALVPGLLARTAWTALLLVAAALYSLRRFGAVPSDAPHDA